MRSPGRLTRRFGLSCILGGEEMTDTELVEWLALNVMKWEQCGDGRPCWSDHCVLHTREWYPLSSMSDAWLVVEEMRRQGWHVCCLDLLSDGRVVWDCWRDPILTTSHATPDARAICEAVHMAKMKEAGR